MLGRCGLKVRFERMGGWSEVKFAEVGGGESRRRGGEERRRGGEGEGEEGEECTGVLAYLVIVRRWSRAAEKDMSGGERGRGITRTSGLTDQQLCNT